MSKLSVRIFFVVFIAVYVTFLSTGCSKRGKVNVDPEKGYLFFPSLPNNPKYQYLTTFSSSKDIEVKKSKFFKFVAGEEKEKFNLIRKPYGVDIFEGVIYVCDIRSNAIVTLDLDKKKLGYFGYSGAGKLMKPINLKIDKDSDVIYISDMGRKQVLIFDLKGRFLKAFGVKGQFDPSDIGVVGEKLFVCDVKGSQIHVLNKNSGELLYKISKKGHLEGELFHPTNIAIFENKLYISDTTNFRISIFDLDGNYIGKFGKIGIKPGNFSRPKGIDIDHEGRIYVVDAAFENVQVFNKEFRLLLFMFTPGGELHNINLPADIHIDYDNVDYFRHYISPDFKAEYLLFVTSQFGKSKVNVYAFGKYEKK